jgi:hypothetical protein
LLAVSGMPSRLPPRRRDQRAFDTPLGAGGSVRSAGVCYRALRRLPGRDSHSRAGITRQNLHRQARVFSAVL